MLTSLNYNPPRPNSFQAYRKLDQEGYFNPADSEKNSPDNQESGRYLDNSNNLFSDIREQFENSKQYNVTYVKADSLKHIHKSNPTLFIGGYAPINPSKDVRKLVKKVDGFKEKDLSGMLVGFERHGCSSGRGVFVPKIDSAGKLNPHKYRRSVSNSASRVVRKLAGFRKHEGVKYLINLELTFPKEFSNRLLSEKDKKKVIEDSVDIFKDFRKRLRAYLGQREDKYFHKLGIFNNPHIWKTKEPFKPHIHHHVNILSAGLIKHNGREYLSCFDKKIDADHLRAIWRDSLESFGYEISSDTDIYIQHHPIHSKGRLMHRLKYCSRKPITDFWNYLEKHDLPEDFNEDYIKFCFNYTNRRRNYGYLVHSKRHFGKIEADLENSCPVCGSASEVEHYSIEEVKELLREGSLDVIQFDYNTKMYLHYQSGSEPPSAIKNSGSEDLDVQVIDLSPEADTQKKIERTDLRAGTQLSPVAGPTPAAGKSGIDKSQKALVLDILHFIKNSDTDRERLVWFLSAKWGSERVESALEKLIERGKIIDHETYLRLNER